MSLSPLADLSARAPLPRAPRPIAVVGAGGIVRDGHLPAYRKAGLPVWSITDLSPAKAQAMAEEFGVPRVAASVSELVATAPEPVVYDVAVPAAAILDVLAQLPRGSAVLLQKPMGENLDQARKILALCRERGMTAAVNFQLRFAPQVLAARSLVESGAIGELHDLEVRVTVHTPWHLWTFLESSPRVEILYHSVHYVDLIRSFFGDPKGIYAKTVQHPRTTRLHSTRSAIAMDYGDLLRATVTTNHGHDFGLRHQESYIKWEGARGAIRAKLGLLMNYPDGIPDSFEFCGEDGQWREIPLEGSWFPDGFIGTMASLQRYVEGSASDLPTSVEDAARTMAVVEAAYESSAQGGQPIPPV